MWGFRGRLWFGYGALAALGLLAGGLGLSIVAGTQEAMTRIMRENHDSIVACRKMNEVAGHAATMLEAGPAGANTPVDTEDAAVFARALAFQQGNITLVGEAELTASLAGAWHRLRDADSAAEARKALAEIQHDTHAIMELNLQNIVSIEGEIATMSGAMRTRLWLLLASTVAIGVVLAVKIGRTIQRPLRALTRALEEARLGNLEAKAPVEARDEIGRLAEAFNLFVEANRTLRDFGWTGMRRAFDAACVALDRLPDAVVVIGAGGDILLSNREAQAAFRLMPKTALLGDSDPWVCEVFEHVRRTGLTLEAEPGQVVKRTLRGKLVRFVPWACPIKDAQGAISEVVLVLTPASKSDE